MTGGGWRAVAVVGWLAACSAAPEPPPPAPAAPKPVSYTVGEDVSQLAEGDDTSQPSRPVQVPVQLSFLTIGKLHQGYFARRDLVRRFGRTAARCVDHTTEVVIAWSNEEHRGRVVGQVPVEPGFTCLPTLAEGGAIDLAPLVPYSKGLATYRDDVANTSDLRIQAFSVHVAVTRGKYACELVAAGQHPPDGSRFDPCVRFAGVEHCAEGAPDQGVTTLRFTDPADAAYARSCFGL